MVTGDFPNARYLDEDKLRSACAQSIGSLKELLSLHSAIDPAESKTDDDPRVLLARKVALHVQAVISQEVNSDSLHVMGPEIRAALIQLEPLVRDMHSGDLVGDQYLQTFKGQLPPFSHPTPWTLVNPCAVGGFQTAEPVMWLTTLCFVLLALVNDYSVGLGTVAELRGKPQFLVAILAAGHRAYTDVGDAVGGWRGG